MKKSTLNRLLQKVILAI